MTAAKARLVRRYAPEGDCTTCISFPTGGEEGGMLVPREWLVSWLRILVRDTQFQGTQLGLHSSGLGSSGENHLHCEVPT